MPRLALALAALAGLLPAVAQASSAPLSAWDGRTIYRQNLVACIGRAPACEKGRLSQDDRDYLTYEMRDQRFAPKVVEQVADVRMEIYGAPVPVIQGRATGARYAASPAARAPAPVTGQVPAQGSAWNGQGGDELAGLANLAQTSADMLRRMGTAVN